MGIIGILAYPKKDIAGVEIKHACILHSCVGDVLLEIWGFQQGILNKIFLSKKIDLINGII